MRNVTTKLWNEVAVEMKEPVAEVKRMWKSLRDAFRRELKKCYDEKSGKGAETIKIWPLFSQMSFLMDVIAPKKSQSSIEEPPDIREDGEVIDDSSNTVDVPISVQIDNESRTNDNPELLSSLAELPEYPTEPKKISQNQLQNPPKKKKKIDYNEKLLEIENKKLLCVQQATVNSQDSDFQFLTSLLPYLRDVPNHKKLKIRAEIMNVLIREQEERNTTQPRAFEPIYHPERPTSISYATTQSPVDDASDISGYWGQFDVRD